jgi:Ni/Fe-hydrogenase subunit HybB-like protein
MQTNSPPLTTGAGYAANRITKPVEWHSLVAVDVFFNGLTTGLFLVAALSELAMPDACAVVAQAAYPLALGFLTFDLLCLVLDLGDPLRFHHMLRVIKLGSSMSVGVWCLTLYSLPLTAIVALDLLNGWGAAGWGHRLAVILGLLPAFGSATYKGVLFSTSSQPAWRDARWLGGYLINAALVLGCAEMLGLSILASQEKATLILRPALVLLLALSVLPLGLLLAEFRHALPRIHNRTRFGLMSAGSFVGGLLVPLCLLLVNGPTPLLAAVLLILLGNLLNRLVLVQLPQHYA